jgi:glycosyltransferase 2 family protein
MPRPLIKTIARLIIGIILILLLFYFVSPAAIIQSLQSINPLFLVGAVLVYACTFLILTIRWRIIVEHMGGYIPLNEAYQAFAGGVLYSDFTPGRVGDLTRAVLIKERLGIQTGVISVMIDRYIDIIVLMGLGVTALVILSSRFVSVFPLIALGILIVIFIGVTILLYQRSWIIYSMIQKIPVQCVREAAGYLQDGLSEFRDGKIIIAKGVCLTIIAWVTHALRVFLIALGLGYALPIPDLFLILPLISTLSLIPITISGLGLVEGGLMAVIGNYGVPLAAALSIAVIDRGLTMLFHFIVGGRYAVRNILQ